MLRKVTVLVALWGLAAFSMGCMLPTSTSTSAVEDWVIPYWTRAQDRLIAAGFPRAREVPADWFKFVAHEPTHQDGDAYWLLNKYSDWAQGHFDPNNASIHYCLGVEHVVIHEAGHAILWKMNEDAWRCWEHPCGE